MTTEYTFSFARFFKYALRYCWIAVLCVAIGIGVCIPQVFNKDEANYERYIGRITFDLTQYAALLRPDGDYSDGEFSAIATQLSQVTEEARTSGVLSETFDDVVDFLYPKVKDVEEKQSMFFDAFSAWSGINAVNVSIYYDVKDASDREIAANVLRAYYEVVREVVTAKYPELSGDAYDTVVTESTVLRDYNLPDDVAAKNAGESSMIVLLLGGVVGGVLSGVILLFMYLFTPRIKCVEEVLPLDCSAVIFAEKENAAAAFVARAETAKAHRIALLTLQKDGAFEEWGAKLEQALASTGATVKTVRFSAENNEWLSYFKNDGAQSEGYELYLYNDGVTDIAAYIAQQADACAFFVDHRGVSSKALADGVKNIPDGRYDCTVLHNVGRSYVG